MITINSWHRKGYKQPIRLVYDITLNQYYLAGNVQGMEVVAPIDRYNGSKKWINGTKHLLSREFGLDSAYSKQVISYFLLRDTVK